MKLGEAFGEQSPETLRRAAVVFRPALAGQGRRLGACVALALLGTGFELLRPWPIKVVFDRILITDGPARGVWGFPPEASLVALALGVRRDVLDEGPLATVSSGGFLCVHLNLAACSPGTRGQSK